MSPTSLAGSKECFRTGRLCDPQMRLPGPVVTRGVAGVACAGWAPALGAGALRAGSGSQACVPPWGSEKGSFRLKSLNNNLRTLCFDGIIVLYL